MVYTLDSCARVKLSSLRPVNTHDLAERLNFLSNKIGRMRASLAFKEEDIDYHILIDLYGEYVYVNRLLIERYIDTFYYKSSNSEKIFRFYNKCWGQEKKASTFFI